MLKDILEKHLFHIEERYESFLDDPDSEDGRNVNKFLTILVLIFMAILSFETVGNNAELYKTPIFVFEAFISFVFAWEYAYRFAKSKNKLHFPFSAMRIIDLLSFLPFFL
jgi:hypothetical protein